MNKKNIAQSFGKAASTYDSDAPVQKWTAKWLGDYIGALPIDEHAKCLEIGCGTGFLSEELMKRLPNAHWTISDLSQDMLNQCAERIGSGPEYMEMDGENPPLCAQKYDLIVSSLAVQWFHDLETGLGRLVKLLTPGGRLVFTTLGKQSFSQWRNNLLHMGEPVGLHDYPSFEDVGNFDFGDYGITVTQKIKNQSYDNGLHFLRALKAIGAQEPNQAYGVMNAGTLRKVLRNLETKNPECKMSYDILLADIHLKDS